MRTALVFFLISSILLGNFILFYFLGIPKLFKQLLDNQKKKNKYNAKQERREEKLRWERNAARKRSGFYAELEEAYNKA
ncbi:hypothetical protein E8E11_010513 [Didymella keratinophila]|nr:hypothetical protein E8E11_010513 [Didymella keratinophila]